MQFLTLWGNAAMTSAGFFWVAFWAFGLGYVISSIIQVFVSRSRMTSEMGEATPRSVALATFFGFISSSCSFSALATARSLFAKGAGFVPSMAFLLASTNLVIELGIIIAVFLGWQFIVGEYIGGIILVMLMWMLARPTLPSKLIEGVRETLEGSDFDEGRPLSDLYRKPAVWRDVADTYFSEWLMVWKDVTVGFTVAGIIAVFVPSAFFAFLFPGTGQEGDPNFLQIVAQSLIGPVAAFFTFIGSMGNIPLAGVLFSQGVSMAGVMAFIFSDLVVFPVLRVNAQFYGWRMALYIAGLFLAALVATALILHYGFAAFGLLPDAAENTERVRPAERFSFDYTLFFNLLFLVISATFGWLVWRHRQKGGGNQDSPDIIERILFWLALIAYAWLGAGLLLYFIV